MTPGPGFRGSDADLLAAAGRGDRVAFDRLYERHRDFVVRVARRVTGDDDLALDVAQDVFVDLLRRAGDLVLAGPLPTYLYPAVRHRAIAIVKTRRRRHAAERRARPPDAERSEDDDDALRRVMDDLPEAQREVLILRFADGLALHDIATALSLPLGTVKSRLRAALATLRADPGTRDLVE